MRWFLLFILVLLSGCTTVTVKKIVSPSESLYYQGNNYYENKDYKRALERYKKFTDDNLASSLFVPAKLNLGMCYFYLGNFNDAYQTLKVINIKDENLKIYLANVLKTCEEKLGKDTSFKPQGELAPQEKINIKVASAYVNDMGGVVVKGSLDKKARVSVGGVNAEVSEDNKFIATTSSWKKGKPIIIVAKNQDGSEGRLEYFPDAEEPDKPINLRIIHVTSNSVELEWDINTEKDIKGYKLYYQLKGGGPLQEVPEVIKATKYEAMGMQNLTEGANKTFQFYLRAVDAMDNYSLPSDILEVTLT